MARRNGHVFLLIILLAILSSTLEDVPPNPSVSLSTEEEFLQQIPSNIKHYITENNTYEAMSNYCPYVKKCSEGKENASTENLTNSSGCCLHCQCGPDCYARGTCCSDKEQRRLNQPYNGTFTSDGRTCVETFMSSIPSQIKPTDRLYLLKQTCLDRSQIETVETNTSHDTLGGKLRPQRATFVDVDGHLMLLEEVVYRCVYPNYLDFLDNIPVTSLTSGQSYRNMFCSYCNNDGRNRKDWDMAIQCYTNEDLPETLFNKQANTQTIYREVQEQGQCSVFWDPPLNVFVDKCFPQKYMVTECPEYAPKSLHYFCTDESLYIPYFSVNAVYRNFFCFICNLFSMREWLLDLKDDGECASKYYHYQPHVPFSVLLDLEQITAIKSDGTLAQNQCDNGLTYNKELGVCLEIMCPFYEVQLIDKCVPFVKSLAGFTMQFRIGLISDYEEKSLPSVYELKETAESIVLSTTNGKPTDICQSAIDGVTIITEGVMQSGYVAARIPEQSTIFKIYETFQKAIEAFNNKSSFENGHLRATITETGIIPINLSASRFMTFENTGHCTDLVALSKRQLCRFVVFHYHNTLADNIISVNNVEFDNTEYFKFTKDGFTEPSVGICEETYVGKVLSKHPIADYDLMKSKVSILKATKTFMLLSLLFQMYC